METIAETPYRIALCDVPSSLPGEARLAAERRYARELERALGGPYEVAAACEVMASLEGADMVSAIDQAVAHRWLKAAATARERALSHIGDADEAYFDVRLN